MHAAPIHIETNRLMLMGYTAHDIAYLFNNLTRREIMKMLGHRTEAEFEQEETKHKKGYTAYNKNFIHFLLTIKSTRLIIGRCGLHNWDEAHHRAELGYYMADKNYENKGLMTEAVKAIIAYGFNHLKLNRIEALTSTYNFSSQKILQKFNFIQEGILRQHYYTNNRFEDSIMYSKLYDEFLNEQKRQ